MSTPKLLTEPLIDKLIAVVATLPYMLLIWLQLRAVGFDIPRLVIVAHMLLQTVTMFARRAPSRVTPEIKYWLLALLASYWTFFSAPFAQSGHALASAWISDAISLASLAIVVYARLSLGRNIGLVPAQRRLVTHGAYAWVRHPIYAGIFVAYAGALLSAWAPVNLLIAATGCWLFMYKSVIEEQFLSADPEYREYLQKVRWRWIPGLL